MKKLFSIQIFQLIRTPSLFGYPFKLKDKVDLSHRFKASCTKIETNEGEIKVPVTASSELRAGVAVRQHKQDGVHTSRIPGVSNIYKRNIVSNL